MCRHHDTGGVAGAAVMHVTGLRLPCRDLGRRTGAEREIVMPIGILTPWCHRRRADGHVS